MASGPIFSMFGRVFGSFGTSARYAARLSAVSSKGRAPSNAGRVPWPGTRTPAGSQNCGNATAKVDRSSIGVPQGWSGLKPLASVQETFDHAAFDLLRLEPGRQPEPHEDATRGGPE